MNAIPWDYDPTKPHCPYGVTRRPLSERFWEKVAVAGPSDCWEWVASRNSDGYGTFGLDGHTYGAHQIAYFLANSKPIPDGLVVRHTCDNEPCCNPAHLLIGTHADNVRDQLERGRHGWAKRDSCSKGHPFDEANTYFAKSLPNTRKCRKCTNETSRISEAKRRAAKRAS